MNDPLPVAAVSKEKAAEPEKMNETSEKIFQCICDLFAEDSKQFKDFAHQDATNKVSA